MHVREDRKRCMLYPEDSIRTQWDVIISVALIISCCMTPVLIAFATGDNFKSSGWSVFNITLDVIFTMDLFVNFNSAIHNEEFVLVDNYKGIAGNYLRGWFVVDFLSVFPFDKVS